MKVKEAPEKLYITYKGYGVFDEDPTVERTKDSQTEYTRTDAFIEKVWNWIEDNLLSSNQQDKSRFYYEQFKKYMEGE